LERNIALKLRYFQQVVKKFLLGQRIADVILSSSRSNMAYTTGQTWGALRKAWKAYRIAKVQNSNTDMVKYATRIRSLQAELGVSQASFPDLNLG
jgi:hypothetical protein